MVDEGDRDSMEAAGGRTDDEEDLLSEPPSDIEDMQDGGGGSGRRQGVEDLGAQQGFLQSEWGGRQAGAVGGQGWAARARRRPPRPLWGPASPQPLPPAACTCHAHAGMPTMQQLNSGAMYAVAAQGPPPPSPPTSPKCNTVPTHPPTHRLLPHPPTACSPTHPPTHPACLPASLPAGHMHFLHRLVNGVHNSDQCIDLQALRKCLSCANNLYAHMIQ